MVNPAIALWLLAAPAYGSEWVQQSPVGLISGGSVSPCRDELLIWRQYLRRTAIQHARMPSNAKDGLPVLHSDYCTVQKPGRFRMKASDNRPALHVRRYFDFVRCSCSVPAAQPP
jgi:hypothetical protein